MIIRRFWPTRKILIPRTARITQHGAGKSHRRAIPIWGCSSSTANFTTRSTGVDLVREVGDESQSEQNKCLYPILRQLGITTNERTHSFSLSSDIVIKYIKLGMVNRNLAVQYCHYLIELCHNNNNNNKTNRDDFEHYTARVANLTQYILKNHKDLPAQVKVDLLVDSASSSESNCSLVCNRLFDEYELWSILSTASFTSLLSACYKFNLWNIADLVLQKNNCTNVFWTCFDALITSMSEILNTNEVTPEERERHKRDLLNHLQKLFNFTRDRRIQFVTKQPELLVQCLESLLADVFKRPVFKMSGRCTRCNTYLPLYDNKSVSRVNEAIRQVLDKQHMGKLHLYSSKGDIDNFYQFLAKVHEVDKKPIDCVIDGLNLAYKNSQGHTFTKHKYTEDCERTFKRHDSRFQVQVLANAIIRSNFLERFRKILVVGKAHMKKWPGLMDFFTKNNIHFYASDNQTKDDLFMLYASTLSPKTLLVTNDFLRDHLALLDDDARTEMERYIDTHQVWIENKTLKAIWPTPFEKLPFADDTCSHFHIPVIDYNKMDLLAQHAPPPHLNNKLTTWLCCSKTKQGDTTTVESEAKTESNCIG